MSYTDLGRTTGLSVSAVHSRVRRLEQRQVITGHTVTVDTAKIGLPVSAFITITDGRCEDGSTLAALTQIPEVVGCYTTTGPTAYFLRVLVPSLGQLDALVRRLRAIPGLAVDSALVLATHFERSPTPPVPSDGPAGTFAGSAMAPGPGREAWTRAAVGATTAAHYAVQREGRLVAVCPSRIGRDLAETERPVDCRSCLHLAGGQDG